MRKILLLLISLTVITFLSCLVYYSTAGFRLSKVLVVDPLDETSSIPIDLLKGRSFSYLGKGHQCYAFVNGDLVLKIVRTDKIEMPFWAFCESLGSKAKKERSARRRMMRESFLIAGSDLMEETGVLYTHFSPSKEECEVILIDKRGSSFPIDIAKFRFVLQKRVELFGKYIRGIEDPQKAYEAIYAYLNVMASRVTKGIENKDFNWETNYGIFHAPQDGIKVAEIDIGRFYRADQFMDKTRLEDRLHAYSKRFCRWLVSERPALLPLYDKAVSDVVEEYF